MDHAARVVALHRYPVKSMTGQEVDALRLDARGVVGDRIWAVRTAAGRLGSGKTTRRFEAVDGVLRLRAGERAGAVVAVLPDGTTVRVDDPAAAEPLSRVLGRPVNFVPEGAVSHFDDGPVSLLGTASLAAVAERRGEPVDAVRFRPNVVLLTTVPFAEDEWVGRRVRIGTAVLAVAMTSVRCAMVDAETADLPAQPGNLVAVGRAHGAELGVIAAVVEPGTIRRGDVATVLD